MHDANGQQLAYVYYESEPGRRSATLYGFQFSGLTDATESVKSCLGWLGLGKSKGMSEASLESDGIDVFVVYNGRRIAKRGDPNTPQAGAWVSLQPGYRVFDKDYPAKLVIERDGKIISR